jgi:hypothetical protein
MRKNNEFLQTVLLAVFAIAAYLLVIYMYLMEMAK